MELNDDSDNLSKFFDVTQNRTQIFSHIRKESLDIYNRVHSISQDAAFVRQVRESYPQFYILPNLRCGAWYTDPQISSAEAAYFKSTDGHSGNWSFNLRRPNLHLLPLIVNHGGIMLVDSTRAGKRIPDALAKTVPIWCAVINRAVARIHPEVISDIWDMKLYTPPGVVSSQEHHQIESRLDKWADALAASSYALPILQLPLRPMWITPTSTLPEIPSQQFLPILCISASIDVGTGTERRASGFVYVQGSGDDHELWGMGLTPSMFWRHNCELLNANRDELPATVRRIVSIANTADDAPLALPTSILNIDRLIFLCSNDDCRANSRREKDKISRQAEEITHLQLLPSEDSEAVEIDLGNCADSRHSCIRMPEGKRGQRYYLQAVLPRAVEFIRGQLREGVGVCISCKTGTDASVGVALAVLAKHFDDAGQFIKDGRYNEYIDKQSIKTRLQWIISSRPQANPSRTTLKRVNEYLLSPPPYSSEKSETKVGDR